LSWSSNLQHIICLLPGSSTGNPYTNVDGTSAQASSITLCSTVDVNSPTSCWQSSYCLGYFSPGTQTAGYTTNNNVRSKCSDMKRAENGLNAQEDAELHAQIKKRTNTLTLQSWPLLNSVTGAVSTSSLLPGLNFTFNGLSFYVDVTNAPSVQLNGDGSVQVSSNQSTALSCPPPVNMPSTIPSPSTQITAVTATSPNFCTTQSQIYCWTCSGWSNSVAQPWSFVAPNGATQSFWICPKPTYSGVNVTCSMPTSGNYQKRFILDEDSEDSEDSEDGEDED